MMNDSNSTELSNGESIVDVGEEQLARVYAKAFLAATESLDQQSLLEELDSLVTDVLEKFADFRYYLTTDFLSHDERVTLIDGVFGGRASEPVMNLLKVLSQNRRMGMLAVVARAARKMYGELQGRHEVRVFVPQPLSADLQQGLRDALHARLGVESDFRLQVKPELIGGMVVQVGDTVFDGSVRSTLERTRQQMVVKAVDAIESQPEKFVIQGE